MVRQSWDKYRENKSDVDGKSYPKRGSAGLSLSRGSNFVYPKKVKKRERHSWYNGRWR